MSRRKHGRRTWLLVTDAIQCWEYSIPDSAEGCPAPWKWLLPFRSPDRRLWEVADSRVLAGSWLSGKNAVFLTWDQDSQGRGRVSCPPGPRSPWTTLDSPLAETGPLVPVNSHLP